MAVFVLLLASARCKRTATERARMPPASREELVAAASDDLSSHAGGFDCDFSTPMLYVAPAHVLVDGALVEDGELGHWLAMKRELEIQISGRPEQTITMSQTGLAWTKSGPLSP